MRSRNTILRIVASLVLCVLAAGVWHDAERAGDVTTEELHTIHFAMDRDALPGRRGELHFTVHKDGSLETAAGSKHNQHFDHVVLEKSHSKRGPLQDGVPDDSWTASAEAALLGRTAAQDMKHDTHIRFDMPPVSEQKTHQTNDVGSSIVRRSTASTNDVGSSIARRSAARTTPLRAFVRTMFMTMSGNVDDYTSSTLSTIRIQLAARLGLPIASVSVAIHAGSVDNAGSVVLAVNVPASTVTTLQLLHSSGALKTLAGRAVISLSMTTPLDHASKTRLGALEREMVGLKDQVWPPRSRLLCLKARTAAPPAPGALPPGQFGKFCTEHCTPAQHYILQLYFWRPQCMAIPRRKAGKSAEAGLDRQGWVPAFAIGTSLECLRACPCACQAFSFSKVVDISVRTFTRMSTHMSTHTSSNSSARLHLALYLDAMLYMNRDMRR